jgi:signal peptidase complex subunit 2
MGILTVYTAFVEKGIFAVAVQKDGNTTKTWQASSDMKKWAKTIKLLLNLTLNFNFLARYDDKYILTLRVKDSRGCREATITKSAANFIDVNGVVLEDLVENELNRLYSSLNSEKKDKWVVGRVFSV